MKKTTTTIKEEYDGIKKTKLNKTQDIENKRLAEKAAREREHARAKLALEKALGGARGKGKNTARGHRVQDEVDLYVRQLLDPFTSLNAVVPDIHSYPTTTFSVTTPFVLSSDANGRACIMVRDGLTFHYTTSSQVDPIQYSSGWFFSEGASVWSSGNEISAIRSTFSSYRPVAMGVRMTYDAAPVDASGRLAMGYFPGTQTMPFMSGADSTYALTYDAFAQYQDVITGAAISGGTVVWKPMTPQNHFRPTKAYFYNGSNDTFIEMAYSNTQLSPSGGATWDIDPEACPSMQGLGLYEDDASQVVSVAGAATKLNELSLPLNTPCLVMMAEGLPASTQCYVGEIVAHYEGIADNRSFSLVQAQHRVATPGAMDKAIHRVSKVHPAHSGGSIQAHKSWVDQAVQITSTIANTAGAVAGIVQNVPRVVQPLLEAAETVAALF
jgi:hypothetical protein